MRLLQRFLPLMLMSGGLGGYSLTNHINPTILIILIVASIAIGFIKKLVKIAIGLIVVLLAIMVFTNFL